MLHRFFESIEGLRNKHRSMFQTFFKRLEILKFEIFLKILFLTFNKTVIKVFVLDFTLPLK